MREAAEGVAKIVAAAEAYVPTAFYASVLRQYLVALRALRSQTDMLVDACGHCDSDAIVRASQIIAALEAACADLQLRTGGAKPGIAGSSRCSMGTSPSGTPTESSSTGARVASYVAVSS